MPPSNGFVGSPEADEQYFPLDVVLCESCNHVQLQHTVDREFLFSEYHYFSSASDPMHDHFGAYADTLESEYLAPDDFVVEIGSNDGILLSQFSDNIQTLGVDPAENVVEAARERGVETITAFFSPDVAETIRADYGAADAICANNVVGHIDELQGLLQGLDSLLAPDGMFVMEVPYLVDLFSNHQFDTIYHEHISYFSVRALEHLVQQYDMELFHVERLDIHGGSIRAFVQRKSTDRSPSKKVSDLKKLELAMGLDRRETYDNFAQRVQQTRAQITTLLESLREDGKRIVGYGAPAKGNILLNYCDIGPETLEYLLDTTPKKQGTFSPGMNIPLRDPDEFSDNPPEYALLLAWNYRSAILEKESAYRNSGGQFIVPIPYVDMP
jgi:D-mycarose 3-C-methyltransferase